MSDPNWPSEGDETPNAGEPSATPPAPPPPPPPPPAPTAGGPGMAIGGGQQSAELGIRFGARLLDGILLTIVQFVVIVPVVVGLIFAEASGSSAMMGGLGFGAALLSGIISVAISLGYYVLMETRFGWTLGKKLLNLEVRGAGGGLPTVEESLRRNGWMALGIVPNIGGLAQLGAAIYIAVTINGSPTNDGWHDGFAGGTTVAKV